MLLIRSADLKPAPYIENFDPLRSKQYWHALLTFNVSRSGTPTKMPLPRRRFTKPRRSQDTIYRVVRKHYAENTFHRTATVIARLKPIIHFATAKSPSIRAKRFS